jgi:hypothetical protein
MGAGSGAVLQGGSAHEPARREAATRIRGFERTRQPAAAAMAHGAMPEGRSPKAGVPEGEKEPRHHEWTSGGSTRARVQGNRARLRARESSPAVSVRRSLRRFKARHPHTCTQGGVGACTACTCSKSAARPTCLRRQRACAARGTRRAAASAVVSPPRVENPQLRVRPRPSPPPRVPRVGITQLRVETRHERARRERRRVPTAATMIVCVRPSYAGPVSDVSRAAAVRSHLAFSWSLSSLAQ